MLCINVLSIFTAARPKSADSAKFKAQFSGKMSAGNSLPLNLTTRPSTALTASVDSKIQTAALAARIRRSKSEAESTAPGKLGFTFGNSKDGNFSSTAVLQPTKYVYESNNSVASSLSDLSPVKAFPIRPASHQASSPQQVRMRQNENKIAANPILRAVRYPNLSDAQAGRWVSESHRSFVNK